MIAEYISTYPDPYQTLDISIGKRAYTIRLRWNDTQEFWVMDMYDREFSPILLGIKLVKNFPLIHKHALTSLPTYGDLILLDRVKNDDRPTREGMGERFKLVYVDWTDDELEKDAYLAKQVQDGSIWDGGNSVWDDLTSRWPE